MIRGCPDGRENRPRSCGGIQIAYEACTLHLQHMEIRVSTGDAVAVDLNDEEDVNECQTLIHHGPVFMGRFIPPSTRTVIPVT